MRTFLVNVKWMDGQQDAWKSPVQPTVGTDRSLRIYLRKSNGLLDAPVVCIPLNNVRTVVVTEEL